LKAKINDNWTNKYNTILSKGFILVILVSTHPGLITSTGLLAMNPVTTGPEPSKEDVEDEAAFAKTGISGKISEATASGAATPGKLGLDTYEWCAGELWVPVKEAIVKRNLGPIGIFCCCTNLADTR